MFKKHRFTLIVLILMLMILTFGSTACSSSPKDLLVEPPEIAITGDPESEPGLDPEPDPDQDISENAANPLISENPVLVRYIFSDKNNTWMNYTYHVKEKDGKKALYTEDDQEVLPYEFEQFKTHYNMVGAQKDGKWLLYDYTGVRLSQDEWEDIIKTTTPMDNEVNGLVRVKKDGVWGCVDQQGEVVITPNWDGIDLNYYEEVEPFLRVNKDGKYGYLTYEGELVLEAKWDMAVMDVYNRPLDEIAVRLNDEWGTVKVVNNKAQEVDWDQKPRLETQIGFMDSRYIAQAQTVHDLLYSDRWGIKPSVILFFYDYYKQNYTEILNLPEFTGSDPDWDQLTKFVYTNSLELRSLEDQEARSYLTDEEFDKIANKYFEEISYTHQPSKWLNYEDGKYNPVGWSDHGVHYYQLKELRRFELGDNKYKFTAKLVGYPFYEDDFNEGSDSLSPNMKALKKKAEEPQFEGRELGEVLGQVMFGDPTEILAPSVEQSIEFTMEDPLADIYLKYLSASREEIRQDVHQP
ncbi:MAG: hypothetical protein APF84_15855 [Gracilibacter sp. BRH_c7a]|nr:MAG: hypothetical protein APF84_15855 [Gracilibacter sp. BRH_c7a]